MKSEKRTLITPLGARRYFMGKLTDDVIREAIAYVPQCTVAHLLNIGLDRTYTWLAQKDDTEDFDLLINIHDAIIFQAVEEKMEEYCGIIRDFMQVPIIIHGRELIIPSDLEVGYSWGEMSPPNWGDK